jgi:hypothetical protein
VDSTVEQELERAEEGLPETTRPESAPELKIDDSQFGTKIGKHAQDYGLDASNATDRSWLRGHIEEIDNRPEEVRQGPWNPRGGGANDGFLQKGQ